MSASRTPRPRLPGPPSAHHERPRRALRRGARPLAALLTALLALQAPAGAGAQNLPEGSRVCRLARAQTIRGSTGPWQVPPCSPL